MENKCQINKQIENQKELLKELEARIYLHKVSITGAVLMIEYMDRESQGDVNLPPFTIKEQADKYSSSMVQDAMARGTFNQLYNNAWESIKNTMPEHMKVLD